MAKKWIQKTHMKKGALHKELGVPAGKKISTQKLNKAEKRAEKTGNTKLERRVSLAKTLKKLHK